MEIWRVYEKLPRFEVSNYGRLRNQRTKKILSQSLHKNGYLNHATKVGGRTGKNVCLKIHRVVAETFLENPDNKPHVNHKDGDKKNNKAENLEWVTPRENTRHAIETGLISSPSCQREHQRLTEEQVVHVVNNYTPWCRENGARSLSRKYGVNKSTILKIVKNSGYKT